MNNDLISRSALRKAVNNFYDNSFKGTVSSDLIKYAEAVDSLIDNAPTLREFKEKYEKKGKWELYQSHITAYDITGFRTWANKYRCSRCGFIHTVIEDFGHYSNCPNCGARMEM